MELERVRTRRERGHAGFGDQPTRCQIRWRQGALPVIAVRAISIASVDHTSAALNTVHGLERSELLRCAAPANAVGITKLMLYATKDNLKLKRLEYR